MQILTLSHNPKIKDIGIKYISECQRWNNIKLLALSNTKLTNVGIKYLSEATMPKMGKLFVVFNNFDDSAQKYIDKIRYKHIAVFRKRDYKYIEEQLFYEEYDYDDNDGRACYSGCRKYIEELEDGRK